MSHPYLLYVPLEYGDSDQRWPLLVFLHGTGERGESLDLVKIHGPPKLIEEGRDFPFIVVSPQLDTLQIDWSPKDLAALIDEIVSTYAVDEDRIYLTGLSMGGYGVWSLAMDYPDRFAALVPIAGGGASWQACRLRHVPIWMVHGTLDTVVPVQNARAMYNSLVECGADVRYTEYPDLDHDSWSITYDDPELYSWMLEQYR